MDYGETFLPFCIHPRPDYSRRLLIPLLLRFVVAMTLECIFYLLIIVDKIRMELSGNQIGIQKSIHLV